MATIEEIIEQARREPEFGAVLREQMFELCLTSRDRAGEEPSDEWRRITRFFAARPEELLKLKLAPGQGQARRKTRTATTATLATLTSLTVIVATPTALTTLTTLTTTTTTAGD